MYTKERQNKKPKVPRHKNTKVLAHKKTAIQIYLYYCIQLYLHTKRLAHKHTCTIVYKKTTIHLYLYYCIQQYNERIIKNITSCILQDVLQFSFLHLAKSPPYKDTVFLCSLFFGKIRTFFFAYFYTKFIIFYYSNFLISKVGYLPIFSVLQKTCKSAFLPFAVYLLVRHKTGLYGLVRACKGIVLFTLAR